MQTGPTLKQLQERRHPIFVRMVECKRIASTGAVKDKLSLPSSKPSCTPKCEQDGTTALWKTQHHVGATAWVGEVTCSEQHAACAEGNFTLELDTPDSPSADVKHLFNSLDPQRQRSTRPPQIPKRRNALTKCKSRQQGSAHLKEKHAAVLDGAFRKPQRRPHVCFYALT